MRTSWLIAALCGANLVMGAAELPDPLLLEAAKGHTSVVKTMLDRGADIEVKDHNGRTALMLAAQHGRLETLRLLLARGAKTEARDREGNTAFMLAMFQPAGHGDHDGVLQALPKPLKPRLALDFTWTQNRLISSCFLRRDELPATLEEIQPVEVLMREFAAYVRASGRGLVDLVAENPDFKVKLEVQPGAVCDAQTGDNLTLNIDARLIGRAEKTVFQRNFGGGIKGLKVQVVSNAAQYPPVFQAWLKAQAEPIYRAVAAEAYRYTPQQ